MKSIDCRGLACPAPVLESKKAIDSENLKQLTVIVDNKAAKENVSRFLESQGFSVSVKDDTESIEITATSKDDIVTDKHSKKVIGPEKQKIIIMIASDRIGYGDSELGKKLLASFIKTLKEMGDELWRLIFVNNGVKLTTLYSEVLTDLQELNRSGIHILVCGTCLTHFDLLDKKQVGETTNMLDIVTAMQLADKVINI